MTLGLILALPLKTEFLTRSLTTLNFGFLIY